MADPYELTALEEPGMSGEPLPEGGGRIAMPGGDVRSFQFEIPAGSNSPEARRVAVQQAAQFDAQRQAADRAAADEQYLRDLMQNMRVEDSAKAVELAGRFQAMRKFERDLDMAKAAGVSPELATIQAASRNPLAFGGGAGAAAVMRQMRAPQLFQAPGMEPVAITPSGAGLRLTPQSTGISVTRTPQGREVVTRGGQMHVTGLSPQERTLTPGGRVGALQREVQALLKLRETAPEEDRVALDADIARMQGVIRQELSIAETPKAGSKTVAAPAAGPSGSINPLPKSKDDLIVGQFYQTSRGVARWTGDHFEKVAD